MMGGAEKRPGESIYKVREVCIGGEDVSFFQIELATKE